MVKYLHFHAEGIGRNESHLDGIVSSPHREPSWPQRLAWRSGPESCEASSPNAPIRAPMRCTALYLPVSWRRVAVQVVQALGQRVLFVAGGGQKSALAGRFCLEKRSKTRQKEGVLCVYALSVANGACPSCSRAKRASRMHRSPLFRILPSFVPQGLVL